MAWVGWAHPGPALPPWPSSVPSSPLTAQREVAPCEAACAAPCPPRPAELPSAKPPALARPVPSACVTGPLASHATLGGAAVLVQGHPERLSDVCCPRSPCALCPVLLLARARGSSSRLGSVDLGCLGAPWEMALGSGPSGDLVRYFQR